MDAAHAGQPCGERIVMRRLALGLALVAVAAVAALYVPVAWASMLAVAFAAGIGIWLGATLAADARIQAAFTRAQGSTLDPELAEMLNAAGERRKRSWRGQSTDEVAPRGTVGSLLASIAVLLRYAWTRHRRTTLIAGSLVLAFAAMQFSNIAALVAIRGALGITAFTAAAIALVNLYTDGNANG